MNSKHHSHGRERLAVAPRVVLALAATLLACDAEPPDSEGGEDALLIAPASGPSAADLAAAQEAAEEADAVFVGEVVSIEHQVSQPNARGKQYPFTVVTWDVEDGVKGVGAGDSYSARFLGGPMGDLVLRISEMPTFEIGDRDLMFIAQNGDVGCPLVGGAKGRVQLRVPGEHADGVSPVKREAGWAQTITSGLRQAGLDDGAPAPTVRSGEAFVFAGPRFATPEQLEAVAARTAQRISQAAPPTDERDADRRERLALEANDFNPVLPPSVAAALQAE